MATLRKNSVSFFNDRWPRRGRNHGIVFWIVNSSHSKHYFEKFFNSVCEVFSPIFDICPHKRLLVLQTSAKSNDFSSGISWIVYATFWRWRFSIFGFVRLQRLLQKWHLRYRMNIQSAKSRQRSTLQIWNLVTLSRIMSALTSFCNIFNDLGHVTQKLSQRSKTQIWSEAMTDFD